MGFYRAAVALVSVLLASGCTGSSKAAVPVRPSGPPTVSVPMQIAVAAPPSQAIAGITVSAQGLASGATTSASGPCTSTGCSFTATAPDEYDRLTIQLTAAGGTVVLSGAAQLDAGEGAMASPQFVFGAAPARVVLSAEPMQIVLGAAGQTTIVALAYDGSNRRIIGSTPFPTPLAIASSGGGGSSALTASSITNPSQTLTLTYNGANVGSTGVTISGSTAGATVKPVTVDLEGAPHSNSAGHRVGDAKFDSPERLASLPTAPPIPPPMPLAYGRRTLAVSSIDLSANFPPAADQGQSNNCSVFSAVYGIRSYMENVERAKNNAAWVLTGTGTWGENDSTAFSPTFNYNQPTINRGIDDGATLDDVARSLRETGAVPLRVVPWTPASPAVDFVPQFGAVAANFKIAEYATIDVADLAKMKDYLASGYAIYFAIDVDNLTTMQNSVWNGPFDGSSAGGHAMAIVGYDDNLAYTGGTGAFKVLNSSARRSARTASSG